jgi:hypothetical protein
MEWSESPNFSVVFMAARERYKCATYLRMSDQLGKIMVEAPDFPKNGTKTV